MNYITLSILLCFTILFLLLVIVNILFHRDLPCINASILFLSSGIGELRKGLFVERQRFGLQSNIANNACDYVRKPFSFPEAT